jgi:hypothetical protein
MDGIIHDLKVVDLSALDVAALLRAKLESMVPKPEVEVILVEFVMQPLPPSKQPSPQPTPELRQRCCVA